MIPQPVGVIATITAWNFPAYLLARKWAGALAAGCTIVGRPSELTPLSAMALVNVMVEAGLAPGRRQSHQWRAADHGRNASCATRAYKSSASPARSASGRFSCVGAADGIKKLSLELGGSAPVLVFADSRYE